MENAIFTNMCMIEKDGLVVVQKRTGSWPGLAFPGGHVEPGEAFAQSVIREVWEETGLLLEKPRLVGVKQFNSKTSARKEDRHEGRYVVMLYRASRFSGQLRSSEEGEVCWMSLEQLQAGELCSGFEDTLRLYLSDDLSELIYVDRDGESQAFYY